ncbi:gastrin/cholecystokinin type B receptor-like [Cylas formicarius]|uniref:gastrin/cholecystokinin type B receptor-like n=1 Tax=Cylas formicarius TaxID=197179 RepID=UPI0029587EF6|nr:gastrin/cholecystokinin type B receptor-like [Cylas formicarius]
MDDYLTDYDDIDSHSIFDWAELIPTLFVYGFSFILGLTGNCLIIFTTFRYRRMQSVTNMFLSSLASSDLLLIIFCIPVKVAKLFSYTWTMGVVLCKSVHYMQNVSAICSVLTLTAISIERYYAIVHPMKAKYVCTRSQAKRIIFFIWLVSILFAFPTILVQIQMPVGKNSEYRWCVRDWGNKVLWRFHELYMMILILLFPFFIMTYSYARICCEVWKLMERRCDMVRERIIESKKPPEQLEESSVDPDHVVKSKISRVKNFRDDTIMVKQVIYMLVTVVTLFAICWSPLLVDNILNAYDILCPERTGALKYMSSAFHLMAYFNSCVNPIIYGFMSKSFRESFMLALCCTSDAHVRMRRGGSNYSIKYISRNGSQTRTTDLKRQESSLLVNATKNT